jgi:hypothetical protein
VGAGADARMGGKWDVSRGSTVGVTVGVGVGVSVGRDGGVTV